MDACLAFADCQSSSLDAELGHLFRDPLGRRIQPRQTFPGVRVFHKPLSVPNYAPDVELVVQHPDATFRVAVDRARIPK